MRTEPPPLAPGDAVVETFPPKSPLAIGGYATAATIVVGILGAAVGGLSVGSAVPIAVCAPLLLLLAPLALGCIRQGTIGPALTTTRLVLPNFLRGWQTVDLASVGGVGLRYHLATEANPGEWRLLLWLDDGTQRSLKVGSVRRLGLWSTTWRDPRTEEEWRHEWGLLAASPAGRAALRIAEQVRLVQGPHGLYDTRHDEISAARGSYETAYWSPGGRLGRLR